MVEPAMMASSASTGAEVQLRPLPLTSLIAMIWLWRDTADPQRIAAQSVSTFWFVLPSLPLFMIIPFLIRAGWGFWPAILIACVLLLRRGIVGELEHVLRRRSDRV